MKLELKGHALCHDTTTVKDTMRNTKLFNLSKKDSHKGAAMPCFIMSFKNITLGETTFGVI